MYKFGKKSNEILDTVNRYLKLSAEKTISKSKIDISIPEWGGLRDSKYQKELYDKGWSNADGTKVKSNHQIQDEEGKSMALDLCAYYKGEQNWNKERLVYIAVLMLESFEELKKDGLIPPYYQLEWGGYWKPSKNDSKDSFGFDRPHFQLSKKKQKIYIES